jgi:hypothetical protein
MTHSTRISHHLDTTLESLFVFFGDTFTVQKSLIAKKDYLLAQNHPDNLTFSLT